MKFKTHQTTKKNPLDGHECVAVIDLFYFDRPYVIDPYTDPGCVYMNSQCVEYAWVQEDTGDDPFGGGSDNGDPCAPCDSSGPVICEEQGGNGVIPESCSVSLNISLITDPCELAELLEDDTLFRQKMGDLLSKANSDNFESGYLFKKNSSGTDYFLRQGNSGDPFIVLDEQGSYDGFMHNHFDSDPPSLSIFSPDDIQSLYTIFDSGGMVNPETFTYGLVTYFGTRYILKIEDISKFQSFGQNFLSGDEYTVFKSNFLALRNIYVPYNGEVNGGEIAFLKILEQYDTGLKLFKGNSDFTDWQVRKLSSNGNSSVNGNCN
ncbi:MAG: hypothetical protein ABJK11_16555 [Balneola sp.]